MTIHSTGELRFVPAQQDDALAQPLLAELAVEYATRYNGSEAGVMQWLRGYPAAEFDAPGGGMLIGVLGERPVTGGAFRRFGPVDGMETAELKRIWTDSGYRRRGLGRALLAALEAEIVSRGYQRIYLTTGDRQPEAEALYAACGYVRLQEPLPYDGETYAVAFIKDL
ncbi:GNAT family N-acetyltransferase [Mycolicibacterium litorale]|nr:GNAT family N-acetyltransferase [Mycolicibacterium litorale]